MSKTSQVRVASILLPPAWVIEAVTGEKTAHARLTKRLAHSSIDLKTIKKVHDGNASQRKMQQLIDEMFDAHPKAIDRMRTLHLEIDNEYAERGLHPNLAAISWRPLITGAEFAAEAAGKEAVGTTVLSSILRPLDDASAMAASAALKGDLSKAYSAMRSSPLSEYVSEDIWTAIRGANNSEAFVEKSAPVRLIAQLFLLAILECYSAPNMPTSCFAYSLPDEESGLASNPFGKTLDRIQEICGLDTIEDTIDRLLISRDNQHFENQRRNYSNWRAGTVIPDRSNFRIVMDNYFILRGITDVERNYVPGLYYGLRFLSFLSQIPLQQFFGSKRAFFALFPAMYEDVKKGVRG